MLYMAHTGRHSVAKSLIHIDWHTGAQDVGVSAREGSPYGGVGAGCERVEFSATLNTPDEHWDPHVGYRVAEIVLPRGYLYHP